MLLSSKFLRKVADDVVQKVPKKQDSEPPENEVAERDVGQNYSEGLEAEPPEREGARPDDVGLSGPDQDDKPLKNEVAEHKTNLKVPDRQDAVPPDRSVADKKGDKLGSAGQEAVENGDTELKKPVRKLIGYATAVDEVEYYATASDEAGEKAYVDPGEPEVSDASVENTDKESTNLSGFLPKENEVKKLESVKSDVENYKKDLSQSNKELSEVEFYKKDISQTKKEVTPGEDSDEESSVTEVDSLGDEVIKKKIIKGSETENVPKVPEVTQDEAPNREHVSSTSLSEDEADMKGAENLVKDATGDARTPSEDEKSPGKDDKVETPAERDQAEDPVEDDDFEVSENETATEEAVTGYCTPRSCSSAMIEPADPAVEQANSEPDQPDAAPTEPVTEVGKEVSKGSEECSTATTPDESDVVPEVMVPDITAEAGPMTEEVVEVNSSEVSATEAVASQVPAVVDVAEE